jgi:lon-related putative ATP-dependent protease
MSSKNPLPVSALYKPCAAADFSFATTRSLEPLEGILGQGRAEEAMKFAMSMPSTGYNIYAVGRNGLGKRTMVMRYLEKTHEKSPDVFDWCYVNNFDDVRSPKVLRLPAGMSQGVKKDIEQLLGRLKKAIPQAFDNESYYERAEQLKSDLTQKQEKALKKIAEQAKKQSVTLSISTPGGYRLAANDGETPYSTEAFAQLPDGKRKEFEDKISRLEKKLRSVLRKLAQWEQDYGDSQQKLNEEVAISVSDHLFDVLLKKYRDLPEVHEHLQAMQKDILENVEVFLEEGEEQAALAAATLDNKLPRRYQLNVMVHHDEKGLPPIVVEDNPNHYNLFGAIENVTYKGTVFTDFSLIRAGALHRANGGFLLMDAVKLLEQPFAWDAIKRSLRSGGIAANALEKELTLSGTISLEPEHVPLKLKIVLFGDRETYLLLQSYDADFAELFKVIADFESEIPRNVETQLKYARFITSLIVSKQLMHCDRKAVMRIIEHSCRVAEHQNRLSLHAADIANLLRESDYWAMQVKAKVIQEEHVNKALQSAEYRSSRIRDQVFESIQDGSILISTTGAEVGQINALSVLSTGDHEFGVPSRLTATCYYGDGHVVDVERDVKLAGAIHSKGMMILTAYLSSNFGRTEPLRLSASITFEQSYSEVDGDSASMAEYCALISAIANVPLRQDLAITGSMNQFGVSQPVGGVNEKIEGFFDTCCIQGLTGTQGVIIPRVNAHNLMLDYRVLEACKQKKFTIYVVEKVEEALELMTGMHVGIRGTKGLFPPSTLLGLVQSRMKSLQKSAARHHDDKHVD